MPQRPLHENGIGCETPTLQGSGPHGASTSTPVRRAGNSCGRRLQLSTRDARRPRVASCARIRGKSTIGAEADPVNGKLTAPWAVHPPSTATGSIAERVDDLPATGKTGTPHSRIAYGSLSVAATGCPSGPAHCASPRRIARPGDLCVTAPFSNTTSPFTHTVPMPCAIACGSSNVARSMTVAGSNRTRSAK